MTILKINLLQKKKLSTQINNPPLKNKSVKNLLNEDAKCFSPIVLKRKKKILQPSNQQRKSVLRQSLKETEMKESMELRDSMLRNSGEMRDSLRNPYSLPVTNVFTILGPPSHHHHYYPHCIFWMS